MLILTLTLNYNLFYFPLFFFSLYYYFLIIIIRAIRTSLYLFVLLKDFFLEIQYIFNLTCVRNINTHTAVQQ